MAKKLSINSSRAISPDYTASSFVDVKGMELPPKTDLEKYTLLMEDVDVSTAVHKFIDALFYSGYTITFPDEEKKNENATKKLLKLYKFPRILRQIAVNARLYQKAFVELVKKPMMVNGVTKKVVVELHVLHTPTITPKINEHGEVVEYIQRVGPKEVKFKSDEIVEIQILPSTASYWGFYDIRGLYETVMTKQLLEAFIDFLFRNGKILPYWVADQQIPKDAWEEFKALLKKQRENPAGELVIQGKIEKKFFERFQFLEDLENYLHYLRGKIFEFFGVPPIAAGYIEGANRSSADTQVRYVWNTSILAFKNILEYEINHELFPKIGIRAEIKFNPFDRLDTRDRIDNALKLKALGLSRNVITYFLRNGTLPEDITWSVSKDESKRVKDKVTNLTAPSRQPRNSDLKEIKSGSESTTREDQIFGK